MKLSDLKFVIKDVSVLSKKDKEVLIKAYRKLFIKTYGFDVVDAFTKVTKTNTNELFEKEQEVKALATNYKKVIEVFKELEDDANSQLLLIYYDNELIGGATLKRLDEFTASVPHIAINLSHKEIERELWMDTVSFVETYFTSQGYKKMYLEVPLKEGPLLVRASELGFTEDANDILVSEEVFTYVLNKNLEGKTSNE